MENDNNSKPNCQDSGKQGIIYLITNLINGKKYVGQTRQKLRDRMYQHRRNKKTSGIDGAIKKYGLENFKVEVIEECPVENLNEREKYWIEFYDCKAPKGYNLTDGGDGILNCSQSTRAKLSKAGKGRPSPLKGRTLSKETRDKLSASKSGKNNPNYGKPLSKETRNKLSEAHMGEKNHFYGKHHSKETKAIISEKKMGKPSPNKGKPSPNRGKPLSQETRDKMSASHKARWERIRAEKAAKALENIDE